ncbi:MAG: putative toxin-antitoxin system toxin component, PIN family [Mogibacterium sp.]|nr:putative toxin-antitoxin system toxin component, PIN family [Mogibacterium sp.]
MTYYAVIDTNVLVSAMLKWQSVPGSILEFSLEGIVVPVLSEEIVEEYKAVLERPKFGLGDDIISDIISSIEKVGLFVDSEEIDIDLPDPKDRVFYEVVMEQRKEDDAFLVTGNIKHFPKKPFIVTPREMLNIILEDCAEYE